MSAKKTSAGSPLIKNIKPRMRAMLLLAGLFAVAGIILVFRSMAASGSLTLSPSSASVGLGSTLSVTIFANSGTDPVNAVQADLIYDQTKLRFENISTSTSAFPTIASSTGGSGTVQIAQGTSGGSSVTGNQIVAVVNFTTIGAGATPVTFASNAALVRSTDNVNILVTKTGGSYTISDTTAPSVPTGVTNPSKTVTSINVAWTASTDNVAVAGYKVFRNNATTPTATVTTPSYNDTGLAPGTSYSYRISAFDAAGNNSAQSAAVSFSTLADTTAPGVPTGLTLSSRTLSSISFSWAASSDNVATTGYKIYRNGTQVGTSAAANFTDSGLSPGTSYSYTVAAHDAAGNTSAQSAAVTFSTLADTTAPSVPTGLTSPTQGASSISLAWTASTDNVAVAGYKIFRNGGQIATSPTNSYTDNNLAGGATYTYTVAAYDAAGNTSAQSAAISASTIVKSGDVDGNGTIDITDLSILVSNYGLSGATRSQGDLNSDGVINIIDLSILLSNYGK